MALLVLLPRPAGARIVPANFLLSAHDLLYLLGFDLLTGVFVLSPLAWLDRRPGVTLKGVLKNWSLVFMGNFAGAFTVACLMAIVFTFGFSTEPNAVGIGRPNPEVVAKAKRRIFTGEYKLRVLEEAGAAAASYRTVKRRLPAYAKQAFRQGLSAACTAHACWSSIRAMRRAMR